MRRIELLNQFKQAYNLHDTALETTDSAGTSLSKKTKTMHATDPALDNRRHTTL